MGSGSMQCIASFTSYPPRIHNCSYVIDSLLVSSIPLIIELNLSLLEFPNGILDLPVALQQQIHDKVVNVNWCPDNPGVFKKIIPTLKKYYGHNYVLFSMDDDRLYKKFYAQRMLDNLRGYDAYCCDRGVVGNRAVYSANIFKPIFWENLSKDMISTGIDDTYISHYLKYVSARCKFTDDPLIRKEIEVYNAVQGHTYPVALQKKAHIFADACFR